MLEELTTEQQTMATISPTFQKSNISRVSNMASGLIGSEILKIAADVRAMMAAGTSVCNLTVGDFSSSYFPIPTFLEQQIEISLRNGETNYPPSDGVLTLRKAIKEFYLRRLGLDYPIESFIVTGGARPAIYGTYSAIVQSGDAVVYPVPSWNNNHYCHLAGADGRPVVCSQESAFLPTAELLRDAIRGARLVSLCSPLNPTGTAFTKETLEGICDLILEENTRRGPSERPLFLMYDQVYWMLTFGETKHYNPVSLRPEMAPYTVFVDGISKAFAATGVRVGWTVAPPDIAQSMSSILGHVGAWAPRAEQIATAKLLEEDSVIESYHAQMLPAVEERLNLLYNSLQELKSQGYPVDAIVPMGAIYLTANFSLIGKNTPSGNTLSTNEDIRKYLLEAAALAIVPFQAFGSKENTGWFRLSVGAVSIDEIRAAMPRVANAIVKLK